MPTKAEKDEFSGTDTTGHVWDGIKELNNPLPRWWLWVFGLCVVWSIAYWVVMPAWPGLTGYTKGVIGYSQRAVVAERIIAAEEARAPLAAALVSTPLDAVERDPELLTFALAAGGSAFSVNCVQCHGTGGVGAPGFPSLVDDAWLWGGSLEEIERTLRVGIRAEHPDTLDSQMPAFLTDELLTEREVLLVARYVLSLSDGAPAGGDAAQIFADNCAVCHGDAGEGNTELGAPRLNDQIWMFGGDLETIVDVISRSRAGVMPAWDDRLSDSTIRALTVYVHALGGGQ